MVVVIHSHEHPDTIMNSLPCEILVEVVSASLIDVGSYTPITITGLAGIDECVVLSCSICILLLVPLLASPQHN